MLTFNFKTKRSYHYRTYETDQFTEKRARLSGRILFKQKNRTIKHLNKILIY